MHSRQATLLVPLHCPDDMQTLPVGELSGRACNVRQQVADAQRLCGAAVLRWGVLLLQVALALLHLHPVACTRGHTSHQGLLWGSGCVHVVSALQNSGRVACSVYSGQLKDALGYSQTQVEGLASPLVALLVVGWLPGVVYDALRHRHHLGPRRAPALACPLADWAQGDTSTRRR